MPLLIAAVGLVGVYFTRYLRGGRGPVYATLAIIVWLAFLASGVHPTLAGVAIALLVPVYRPDRRDVEHALDLARTFRQSPNTEYARAAANSLRESISINERLQSAYAPYVAYVILPLFALANAGVVLSPEILGRRDRVAADVGHRGRPGGRQVRRRLRLRRRAARSSGSASSVRASPSTASLGGAALCGIGFTISLFIVDLAIDDPDAQNEARVGVLAASVIAFVLATDHLPRSRMPSAPTSTRARRSLRPVDPKRDHVFGSRRRAVHDRRVRRLPVRLLPQGVGLDPGGARTSSATSCATSGGTRR